MSKTDKLNKWADLLLDTGKRNNLINFRESKSGTIEIVCPDSANVFGLLPHCDKFELLAPSVPNDDIDIFDDKQDEAVAEKTLSKADFVAKFGAKLKKQQLLAYNSGNNPLQAIKNISKKAKSAIEETGVNIAYLTFGLVHWKENGTDGTFHAPLLLVPVLFENESAISPYYIKIADDDVIVNPTFKFKLQNEYGIHLPDQEEEALPEYLEKIATIVGKLGWTVSAECKLGTFSFLKINMYNDLKDNAHQIVHNPGILTLLGEGPLILDTTSAPPQADLLELHNVVDADSSQAEAIQLAKEGKSFVLQGPPGTGKSQTITNIIGECLSAGKKVLFVSEKLAALNVVYDKLKRAGLEEFCLELHSHKANKKAMIDELCQTLKQAKSALSNKAGKEVVLKKDAQQKLDAYTEELHKIQPNLNKSLYQIFEEIAACRNAPTIPFVIYDLEQKGEDYIEQAETALSRYVEYTASVGKDYHQNCWYGYKNLDCSYQAKNQLDTDFRSFVRLCESLHILAGKCEEKYGLSFCNLKTAVLVDKFFNLVSKSDFVTPALLNKTVAMQSLEAATKLQQLAEEILTAKSQIDSLYDEEFYNLDGPRLHKVLTRQYNSIWKRLFGKEYKQLIAEIDLYRKNGKKSKYKNVVADIALLNKFQTQNREFAEVEAPAKDHFGQAYKGVDTNFELLVSELACLCDVHAADITFGTLTTMSQEKFLNEMPNFRQIASAFNTAFGATNGVEQVVAQKFDAAEVDIESEILEDLIRKINTCLSAIDKLDNWCEFHKLLQQLTDLDLKNYVNYTIDNGITPDAVVDVYKKCFYVQWADNLMHSSPVLTELTRVPHDEVVKRFKEKDELTFQINRADIKARLSAQRPNLDLIAGGSAIQILLREGEKKRKQKGIRQLLGEITELTQTLKPCFLMSPLSVSTFLSPEMRFDVVVFDEASQIFPQDAVGAIYRGKQLIVVGDSKQMPPSNFFNSTVELNDEIEDEDITDFESILDICSTSFPQKRLKWHYRSRFEELITFSNKNFYDNDLVTFPSAKTKEEGVGVDFYHVDGTFDRKTKTNRAEAEKIVDIVFENIEKHPERSLGVVAFSISQQSLIDKLIAKRRQANPSKEEFFKSDKDEPFFVKNLETVQGDERDTIIFSMAYAKDEQGKLLLNFGPLNRIGGERRLNVAVTRAKLNVQVVSSMHYYDIDLSRTNSAGAQLLREYLDYAENGTVALTRSAETNPFEESDNSDFALEVCDFLRQNGFFVDTQVGCSTLKIDLAVKAEENSNYILAIECDGKTYHASKTTRDRDRLRQSILESMGWKYYRVWSTDWFRNKLVEKERLLSFVKNALENAAPATEFEVAEENSISFEESVPEVHFEFPQYEMVNAQAFKGHRSSDILNATLKITQTEAPVSEEWLLKRIVHMFDGREKVTNVVRADFDKIMWNCQRYGIVRHNGFLYMRGKDIPMLRTPAPNMPPRAIKHIALEELALGIREILKHNITVEKTGMFRLLSQQLGFHLGEAIVERFETALALISDDIETNGKMLSLKD